MATNEERITQLETSFSRLDRLRVAFLVAISLAGIFGVSAGAIAYKTWSVWEFVSDGEMRVVLRTNQKGGKLFRIDDERRLIADSDPKDGANEANIFLLQDPERYPLR